MQPLTSLRNRFTARRLLGVATLVFLVAAALRLGGLPDVPPGPHYDEAANGILAAEIANGVKRPVFIPSYTGKEVLFFYMTAAAMRVLGVGLLALRLTSALAGLLTVGAALWLVYELFADDDPVAAPWLAVLTAVLVATSFWHVVISRVGFRAVTQPLLQALTLAALWRGLRQRPVSQHPSRQHPEPVEGEPVEGEPVEGEPVEGQRSARPPTRGRGGGSKSTYGWLILGGLLCGLTGYTYLAARAFPIPIAIALVTLWLASAGQRRGRLLQIVAFGLAALVAFAPLGLYFFRHPEAFTNRMSQVGPGNDWGAALDGLLAAFKMLFLKGDPYIRFNLPYRPLFGPLVALLLLVGLGVTAWRFFRPRTQGDLRALERAREVLLLAWIPFMLLPTALAVNEITPSNLRAVGLIPLVFLLPARGLWMLLTGVRVRSRITSHLPLLATGLLLLATGVPTTLAYFCDYVTRTDLYEASDGDLADIATYLNHTDLTGTSPYVGSIHYRHPTVAFLADAYARIKWLVGASTIVYPANGAALYLFPRSATPAKEWLADHLANADAITAPTASDGAPAFTGYYLAAPPPPPDEVLADFSAAVRLLRYQVHRAVSGDAVDVTVVWQILAPPLYRDLIPFYHLEDPWGFRWGQAEPFHYAAEDWTPGEIVVDRVQVPIAPGAPPGDYLLQTGLYSRSGKARLARVDAASRFVGTTMPLTFSVARAETPPDVASLNIHRRLDIETDAGLTLLGVNLDTTEARPGERIHLTLFWQADQALEASQMTDYAVNLILQDVAGNDIPLYSGAPVHGTYPTSRWTTGEIVVDRYNPRLPLDTADAPPGDYPLAMTLSAVGGEGAFAPTVLGTLTLLATDRSFEVPAMYHTQQVTLADQIELLGYDIDLEDAHPGGTIPLVLYWRALKEMDQAYTVFTHLLGPDGQILAQQDNPPVNGTYPTTLWLPGEIVVDPYTIPLPTDLPPGDYPIQVGFYIAENGLRLADPVLLDTIVSVRP